MTRGTARSPLETVTLRVATPCCGRRVRLKALVIAPREAYERRCRGCGADWYIRRRTASTTRVARVDILEWEPIQRD